MRRLLTGLALCSLAACGSPDGASLDFPNDDDSPGGKADVFGRRLAGVAAPFTPNPTLAEDEARLRTDLRYRREVAWDTLHHVLAPVPLLGLAEGEEASSEDVELEDGEDVPRVPRWQTWYGIDDLRRVFQTLYEGADPSDRVVRAPFGDEALDAAFEDNATALDRSRRWPLERYLDYVERLGACPEGTPEDECARRLNSNFSGATVGNARILYSPGTARHILESYGPVVSCLEELDAVGLDAEPVAPDQFTACFDREFPADAVLIKAQWVRADFGMELPAYDTDAEAMTRRLEGAGTWEESGDRLVDPSPDEIVTIRLRNGDTYRLAGLHVMTKELRHWQWITLFWSDTPSSDFGADRPAGFLDGLDPIWGHYKMCAVVWYEEQDEDPAARYEADHPSLAAALRAVGAEAGRPTWCSNPYVEHGRNNARTNCIGCHQHGGATAAHDLDDDGAPDAFDLDRVIDDGALYPETGRRQQREVFPADYLYSFNRVDDFAGMIQREVTFFDRIDEDAVAPRVEAVRMLEGDASGGEAIFGATCVRCHGADGMGTDRAPSLYQRVPMRPDESIVRTLIQGRGGMPAWSDDFDDAQLADLLAYLRATFGSPE
ncbi:MAG TPA: c-type cytochrome [Sandaracinaceae bacterium LLY-WYZ-13_1]|nr:c-type cytochrome [Sandaracinaceae bacterium LLY-WYZ-13_1]